MARRDRDDDDRGDRGSRDDDRDSRRNSRDDDRGRDDDRSRSKRDDDERDDRSRDGDRSRSRSRDDDNGRDDRPSRSRDSNSRGSSRDRDRGDDDSRSSSRSSNGDKSGKAQSVEVRLDNVRLSYPKLFRAEAFQDGDGEKKYGAALIIDPSTKEGKRALEDCEKAIDDAKFNKWGNKQPAIKASKQALREGDDDRDDPAYEGMWYVQASSTRRPQVIDRDRSPLTEEDGKPYAGSYVNAIVRFWAQDNKWGKRVNASLEAIQFFKDGDAFGAAPIDTDKAFDSYNDDHSSDRGSSRGRGRDRGDDDDRSSRRSSRDDDRGRSRDRDDSKRDDDDRGSRNRDRGRDRDDSDDRGRGSAKSRDRDDDDDRDERFERGRR